MYLVVIQIQTLPQLCKSLFKIFKFIEGCVVCLLEEITPKVL